MSNEWHTPLDLTADLQRAIGGRFDVDPASGCEPVSIARTTYTKADNGLEQPWFGNVFVNPPYDRTIADWMEKAHTEAQKDRVDRVVALIPARASTQWWHNHVSAADALCLIEGRLKFGGSDSNARFPCALVVYGDVTPRLNAVLTEWGRLYEPREVPDIADATVGAVLEIELDDRGLGFPEGVEPRPIATVEAGRVTEDGLVEIMAVQPANAVQDYETYYLISFPEDDPMDLRCTVENTALMGWRHVPIQGYERRTAGSGIDPLTYVA
jgi:phage N-6-adenine-methyltransferase